MELGKLHLKLIGGILAFILFCLDMLSHHADLLPLLWVLSHVMLEILP